MSSMKQANLSENLK